MGYVAGIFAGPGGRLNRARLWLAVAITLSVMIVLVVACFGLGLTSAEISTRAIVLADGQQSVTTVTSETLAPLPTTLIQILGHVLLLVPLLKRRHDRGNSGADAAIVVVLGIVIQAAAPFLGENRVLQVMEVIEGAGFVYLFVVAGCRRGTAGPNAYGPDPLALP